MDEPGCSRPLKTLLNIRAGTGYSSSASHITPFELVITSSDKRRGESGMFILMV